MMVNDPRTEEEADADWRRVTESLFGTNTRAEPKVEEWEDSGKKTFRPNWGNDPTFVTQELKDEERGWADHWTNRSKIADRKQIDRQREGGGSPVRDKKPKSTFLDDIDDPRGDYVRAGAKGYERGPQYPYTMEDVRRHDAEVTGTLNDYTHPEHASSSSAHRQMSSSNPPKLLSEEANTCVHGVKTKKKKECKKRKTLSGNDAQGSRIGS
jgi:hypothetical protein